MEKKLRALYSVLLTIVCVLGGFGFYRMSSGDLLSSVAFGIGMLGILFSFLRNSKKS